MYYSSEFQSKYPEEGYGIWEEKVDLRKIAERSAKAAAETFLPPPVVSSIRNSKVAHTVNNRKAAEIHSDKHKDSFLCLILVVQKYFNKAIDVLVGFMYPNRTPSESAVT